MIAAKRTAPGRVAEAMPVPYAPSTDDQRPAAGTVETDSLTAPAAPGTTAAAALPQSRTVGSGAPAAANPVFLPESTSRRQRVFGAEPAFPPMLVKKGLLYLVLARVCVDAAGAVSGSQLLKRAEPTLDANVLAAVAGWRYRPWLVGGRAVPFCTFVNIEFRGE